jgi:hypothetical protein
VRRAALQHSPPAILVFVPKGLVDAHAKSVVVIALVAKRIRVARVRGVSDAAVRTSRDTFGRPNLDHGRE